MGNMNPPSDYLLVLPILWYSSIKVISLVTFSTLLTKSRQTQTTISSSVVVYDCWENLNMATCCLRKRLDCPGGNPDKAPKMRWQEFIFAPMSLIATYQGQLGYQIWQLKSFQSHSQSGNSRYHYYILPHHIAPEKMYYY